MGWLSPKPTASKTYKFQAVISPRGRLGEQVADLQGEFSLDSGETVEDVKRNLLARYGRKAFLVSFTYH